MKMPKNHWKKGFWTHPRNRLEMKVLPIVIKKTLEDYWNYLNNSELDDEVKKSMTDVSNRYFTWRKDRIEREKAEGDPFWIRNTTALYLYDIREHRDMVETLLYEQTGSDKYRKLVNW